MPGLYRSNRVGMPDFASMANRSDIDLETGLIRRPAPRPYPFGPVSVAAVLDAGVRDHPNRSAVIDDVGTLTYVELDREVHRVAGAIQAATMAGDVVAWCAPNSADLVVGFLATLRVGRVWLGINPRLPADARADLVGRSGAQMVVDAEFTWPVAPEPAPDVARDTIAPHAPAVMSPTSGTTGQPKLVVHSQHGLLWPGLVSIEAEPIEENERTLCALPTHHAHPDDHWPTYGTASGRNRGHRLHRVPGRAPELDRETLRHTPDRRTDASARPRSGVASDRGVSPTQSSVRGCGRRRYAD